MFDPPTALDFRVELKPAKLDAIDFMKVKNCALKATILKNQTRIARYASDSQRLLLDLEYLRLAPRCIAQLQSRGVLVLAHTLESARQVILRQLPSRIFNATLASDRYRQVWQTVNAKSNDTSGAAEYLRSLRGVNRAVETWLSHDYTASNLDFEIQLSEVAKVRVNNPTYRLHLAEVVRLELLLQKATPMVYQRWQQRR